MCVAQYQYKVPLHINDVHGGGNRIHVTTQDRLISVTFPIC